jgi:hypothetical protein
VSLPKRTINEWITVSRVNGTVRTVFAEGASDARLLAIAAGLPETTDFRSADEIDLDEIHSSAFDGGNKVRVQLLAVASDRSGRNNIRCLVDGDFAVYLSSLTRSRCLKTTDFANLVAGCVGEEWLRGFLLRGYGVTLTKAEWENAVDWLRFSFNARYIAAVDQCRNPAPSLSEFISRAGSSLKFDRVKYTARYFGLNGPKAQEVVRDIESISVWCTADVRHFINSTDLFDYVYTHLRRLGAIGGGVSRDSVRSAILAALPLNLAGQRTVGELVDWALRR